VLGGIDHLLFVLGLLLLVGWRRRLVTTITAFTAGHSVTLALASLEVVRVAATPVEVCIALSVLLLAWELSRARDARQRSLTVRHPEVIAALFGLVHGLGFAGALLDLGLAADALPWALLGFNLGVEAGQLLFVVGVAGLWLIAQRSSRAERPRWDRVAAYAMGITAAWLALDRVAALLPAGAL